MGVLGIVYYLTSLIYIFNEEQTLFLRVFFILKKYKQQKYKWTFIEKTLFYHLPN